MVDGDGPAVAGLHAAVDALLAVDLSAATGTELVGLLRGLEAVRRRLAVVDQRLIAEIEAQRVAATLASCSTVDLLREVLRVAPREAAARVRGRPTRSAAGVGW